MHQIASRGIFISKNFPGGGGGGVAPGSGGEAGGGGGGGGGALAPGSGWEAGGLRPHGTSPPDDKSYIEACSRAN